MKWWRPGPDADPDLIGQRVCFLAPRGVGTWRARELLSLHTMGRNSVNAVLRARGGPALSAGISAMVGIVRTAKVNAGMRGWS